MVLKPRHRCEFLTMFLVLQMLNQTSRLEIQLLENSLSTNKLEKQVLLQTQEITRLHDKNGYGGAGDQTSGTLSFSFSFLSNEFHKLRIHLSTFRNSVNGLQLVTSSVCKEDCSNI